MSDAYKCDKCKEYVDEAVEVGFGGNAHMGTADRFYHLCSDCESEFEQWFSKYCDD